MIFSLTDKLGCILVQANNGVKAGEILMGDDGFYQFWPELRGGYWPSYAMREIADKVDSMNEAWEKKLEEELAAYGEFNNA